MSATLIVINGTSSAGKSNLARSFQRQCAAPNAMHPEHSWLDMSLDRFFAMFPPGTNNTMPHYERMLSAYYQTVTLWAHKGYNIVVDTVFETPACVDKILDSFSPFRVYMIGLFCPLEELERREKVRGNRRIGLAREQYERVHRYCLYDVELNSYSTEPAENARQLEQFLEANAQPRAFQEMLQSRQLEIPARAV